MQWRRFAKSPDPLTVAELVLRTTEYFGSAGAEPSTFRSMPFAILRAFKGVRSSQVAAPRGSHRLLEIVRATEPGQVFEERLNPN